MECIFITWEYLSPAILEEYTYKALGIYLIAEVGITRNKYSTRVITASSSSRKALNKSPRLKPGVVRR